MLPRLEVQADLILTSPPYDDLRIYDGTPFEFDGIANACVGALSEGGVLVWVVGDAVYDGSETGTSFRQALGFMDRGLTLHDTMIFQKSGMNYPCRTRYHQVFEYMFVFTKGKIRTVNLLRDRPNRFRERWSEKSSERRRDGTLKHVKRPKKFDKHGVRWNIWRYETGGQNRTSQDDALSEHHPARFPDALAIDHILSWTNAGDLVIDPMAGSGTTLMAAKRLGRNSIGIEIHAPYVEKMRMLMAQQVLQLDH